MIRQNVNLQSRLIDDLLDVMRIVRGKMPLHWEVVDAHVLINQAVADLPERGLRQGAQADARPRRDAPPHQRRPGPAPAGVLEPDQERRQVHPGGRLDRDPDPQRVRLPRPAKSGWSSRSPTPGSASSPRSSAGSSTRSSRGRPRSPGGSAAWAWAWRSARGSSRGTAGRSDGREPGQGPGDDLPASSSGPCPTRSARTPGRSPGATTADPAPSTSSLKILLVEDEQATRRLMARLLKGLGHEVATAGTIAEALERAESADFEPDRQRHRPARRQRAGTDEARWSPAEGRCPPSP